MERKTARRACPPCYQWRLLLAEWPPGLRAWQHCLHKFTEKPYGKDGIFSNPHVKNLGLWEVSGWPVVTELVEGRLSPQSGVRLV